MRGRGAIADVVVLTETRAEGLVAGYLPPARAAVIPVIDGCGEQDGRGPWKHRCADLHIKTVNSFSVADALVMLRPLIEQFRGIAEGVLRSTDPRITLLARLAVRGRDMVPVRDPTVRETVTYPDAMALPNALAIAEELAYLGCLERQFFDRLITCPRCASARLSVRERCSRCDSADLVEEAVVHHLRCSTQAPERDFRQGTSLICPKCRLHLEHFSVDYDRPGSVMFCGNCRHVSSDTAVGFICLDCDARGGTDEIGTRTVWSYRLTESGLTHVRCGTPVPNREQDGSSRGRLEAFILREERAKRPCCVLAARLSRPPGVGDILWDQTCGLFARLFQEMFTPETETIESGRGFFLALLAGDRKNEVERALPDIRIDLERHLIATPPINYAVFGPDEIRRMLGSQQLSGSVS